MSVCMYVCMYVNVSIYIYIGYYCSYYYIYCTCVKTGRFSPQPDCKACSSTTEATTSVAKPLESAKLLVVDVGVGGHEGPSKFLGKTE